MRWFLLLTLLGTYACGECPGDPLGNLHKCYENGLGDPPVQYEAFGQLVRFKDGEGPTEECYRVAMLVVEDEALALTSHSVINALEGFHVGWYNNLLEDRGVWAYGFSHSLQGYLKMTYNYKEAHGLPESTWVHEIGHMIQELLLDRNWTSSDYDHVDTEVWDWVLKTEHIVAQQTESICAIEQQE